MGYRELIKRVQHYSGFSDAESKDALEHLVECLATRLTETERMHFASQLPTKLQDIALAVSPSDENSKKEILQQFMDTQKIPENRAKKQVLSAWRALKDAISKGEIDDIRAQLPNNTVAFLH